MSIDEKNTEATELEEKDDDFVVEKVKQGDKEAFGVLVMRYHREIFAFVRALVRNQHTAEDLVQETFLKAFAHIHTYRKGNFRQWLYKIARNCTIDFVRSWNSKHTDSIEEHASIPDTRTGTDPHQLLADSELVAVFEEALGTLPPALQEAFVLKHILEMNYTEMKKITGVPVALLKVRVHRSRKRLAEHLKHFLNSFREKAL